MSDNMDKMSSYRATYDRVKAFHARGLLETEFQQRKAAGTCRVTPEQWTSLVGRMRVVPSGSLDVLEAIQVAASLWLYGNQDMYTAEEANTLRYQLQHIGAFGHLDMLGD